MLIEITDTQLQALRRVVTYLEEAGEYDHDEESPGNRHIAHAVLELRLLLNPPTADVANLLNRARRR